MQSQQTVQKDSKFSLQLIQQIWIIEHEGLIWYEFEEEEEHDARSILARLQANETTVHFL